MKIEIEAIEITAEDMQRRLVADHVHLDSNLARNVLSGHFDFEAPDGKLYRVAPGASQQHRRMPPATADMGDQVVAVLEGRRQSVPAPFVALPSAGTPAPAADIGDQIVVQLLQRRGKAIPADLQHAVAVASEPVTATANGVPRQPLSSVERQADELRRVRQTMAAGDVGDQIVSVLEQRRGMRSAV